MKRILIFCIAAICAFMYSSSALADDEYMKEAEEADYTADIPDFTLTIGRNFILLSNGEKVIMDTKPYIKNGRTYIPLRAVCETMKAKVDYIPQTETVVIEDDTLTAKTDIGSSIITVSFKDENIAPVTIETDAAAEINEDGRTMVPVRAITEDLFGCSVAWDELNQRISVSRTYQLKRLIITAEKPGGYADGLYGIAEYFGNGGSEYTVQFKNSIPELVIKRYRSIIEGKDGVKECIPDIMLDIEF